MNARRTLPVRMHFKHGRYYYVEKNKWHPLAADLGSALQQYAKLISTPTGGGLDDIVDRVMAECKSTIRESTYKNYQICADRIKTSFAEFSPDQVKAKHVAQFIDAYRETPSMANMMRNVLKVVFNKAVLLGLTDSNPVTSVPPLKTKRRDRYITEQEFQAIRAKATPTLQAIMDICYITGQRIGDVLKIRHSDIEDDGICVQQEKTGNRLKIRMTADLRDAIGQARALHRSVKGFHLFHTRQGKPFSYWTIRTLWQRATTSAGVEDAHIHDIRAKAATDAKAQGLDSKSLLGHASESAHLRYLRGKETPVAEPVRIRKS